MPVSQGIVQNPTLWAKLTRAFSVKGSHVTPELGGVIHPVAVVEDLTRGGRYELTEKPAGMKGTIAASVGNPSCVGLIVPAGPAVLALPRTVRLHVTAATDVFLLIGAGAVGFQVGAWLDTRLAGLPNAGVFSQNAAAPGTPSTVAILPGAITPNALLLELHPSTVIGPGFYLAFQTAANNVGLTVNFDWAEIPSST